MSEKIYAAHIAEDKAIHLLEEHLAKVGDRAEAYASPFASGEWAKLAGRWHDLGKYSAHFQKMIYEANGMEAHVESGGDGPRNHSSAGALYAVGNLVYEGR